jgi:U3 small nucleolar RNA-associated protein 24
VPPNSLSKLKNRKSTQTKKKNKKKQKKTNWKMGKQRRTRQYRYKKVLSLKDDRLNAAQKEKDTREAKGKGKKGSSSKVQTRHVEQANSSLFFRHNESLGPPYYVLLDTNFINFAIKNKLEICQSLLDTLYAKSFPCITDCVFAEIEKLGPKYHVALRIAKDPRFTRLPCMHKGTYADDCLVRRVTMHRCYIVATCDKELRQRLRRIPGVPIMFISQNKFAIERMPEVF